MVEYAMHGAVQGQVSSAECLLRRIQRWVVQCRTELPFVPSGYGCLISFREAWISVPFSAATICCSLAIAVALRRRSTANSGSLARFLQSGRSLIGPGRCQSNVVFGCHVGISEQRCRVLVKDARDLSRAIRQVWRVQRWVEVSWDAKRNSCANFREPVSRFRLWETS